jgi:hypothetical protein
MKNISACAFLFVTLVTPMLAQDQKDPSSSTRGQALARR